MLYPSALVPIRAKTFIGKMCSLYRFIFMEIELICMKTCFETEAQALSEMAYSSSFSKKKSSILLKFEFYQI